MSEGGTAMRKTNLFVFAIILLSALSAGSGFCQDKVPAGYWDTIFTTQGMDGTVLALASGGGDVYAGGTFIHAGGVEVNRIARWNGSVWSAMGT